MTSNDSVNKCVRLAADSIERWGASPAQVESAIEKAILLAIEEDRKSRECCKAEREACAMIADEMKAELSQRPEKLQYGRTQIEVAEYIATEIRARKSKGD